MVVSGVRLPTGHSVPPNERGNPLFNHVPTPITSKIVAARPLWGGYQWVWRFENGYGASVIKHAYSHGLELAVIFWPNPDDSHDTFRLTYATPITNDVIGHLRPSEVAPILERIAAL
jgi:hypothetical protein